MGSRITAQLELDLLRLRSDFEQRLMEKDVIISGLREEKQLLLSKIAQYETVIMPYASRAGAEVVAYQKPKKPAFSFVDVPAPKSRWQQVQDDWENQLAEEEKQKAASAASKE
jgi:hypothetical protein